MTADITAAIDTFLAVSEVKISLVIVADPAVLPAFQAAFPDAAKRQRTDVSYTVIWNC
jgi:hypothetical protein